MNKISRIMWRLALKPINLVLKAAQDHQLKHARHYAGDGADAKDDEYLWLNLGEAGIVMGEHDHRGELTLKELLKLNDTDEGVFEFLSDDYYLYEGHDTDEDVWVTYDITKFLKSFYKAFDERDYDKEMVRRLKA